MGTAERKKRHEDNLKQAIIQSAMGIAAQEGWEAVSTRRIAEEIEYSTSAIYHYFGNKSAILLEIQREGFVQLRGLFLQAVEAHVGDASQQLLAISLAYFDLAFREPQLYKLMFSVGVECRDKPGAEISKSGEVVKTVLKELSGEDINALFMNWWALTHGFISIGLTQEVERRETLQSYLEIAVKRFISSF